MKIFDAETFELKHTFEQVSITNQLTSLPSPPFSTSFSTSSTSETYVSFLEPNENTPSSPLEKVIRVLGECVHDGGYNVTSEILSFLSPAHLPVQITPTRWKLTTNIGQANRIL